MILQKPFWNSVTVNVAFAETELTAPVDKLTIPEGSVPPQSALFESLKRTQVKYWEDIRASITSAAIAELGDGAVENCYIPSTNETVNVTQDAPLNCNMAEEFKRG